MHHHEYLSGRRVVDAADEGIEPLAVDANKTCRILGIGKTLLWELTASGQLESFMIGRRRLWTMAGLKAFVARRLAAEAAGGAA